MGKIEGVNIPDDDPNVVGADWRDCDWLFEKYWDDGLSPKEIVETYELPVSRATVDREIRSCDFPTRSARDSRKLREGKVRLKVLREEYGVDDSEDDSKDLRVLEWPSDDIGVK